MVSEDSDSLLTFISNLAGVNYKRVEEDFEAGFVRLEIAEAERRQAKHDIQTIEDVVAELLRNSRDARANRIFLAFYKKNVTKRHIVVVDDGCGIPASMHEKVFESRVTSKLDSVTFDDFGIHGRGMALYSIKSVVDEARIVNSQPDRGSVLEVIADTSKLPERKDQSAFPAIRESMGKFSVARGPHNVPRLLLEFSLNYPKVEIFFGSPAQVVATMYGLASQFRDSVIEKQDTDGSSLTVNRKVYEYIGSASEAVVLSKLAKKYYGLDVSERNGWRILGGEIKPLLSVISFARDEKHLDKKHINIFGRELNVTKHIPQEELENLSKAVGENIREIERKYFVKIQGEPKVRRSKNQISITINLARDDY